jgi:hypothetical protein
MILLSRIIIHVHYQDSSGFEVIKFVIKIHPLEFGVCVMAVYFPDLNRANEVSL